MVIETSASSRIRQDNRKLVDERYSLIWKPRFAPRRLRRFILRGLIRDPADQEVPMHGRVVNATFESRA